MLVTLNKGDPMTLEEEARQEIDKLLESAGWQVKDYKSLLQEAVLGMNV
jgi:type I site-specific restriction endonuclease